VVVGQGVENEEHRPPHLRARIGLEQVHEHLQASRRQHGLRALPCSWRRARMESEDWSQATIAARVVGCCPYRSW
jgi:hypothetical protein